MGESDSTFIFTRLSKDLKWEKPPSQFKGKEKSDRDPLERCGGEAYRQTGEEENKVAIERCAEEAKLFQKGGMALGMHGVRREWRRVRGSCAVYTFLCVKEGRREARAERARE